MSDTFSSNDGFHCYQHTAEEAADAQVNNNTLGYPPAARSLLLPPSNVPGQVAGNNISKSDLIVTSSHFTYNDGFSGGMSSVTAIEVPSSQLLPTLEFEAEQWHLNPLGGKAEQGVHPLSGTIGPNSSALPDLQPEPDRVVPAQENVTRLPEAPSPSPISRNWLQPSYSDLTSTPFDISQALYKLATRPAPLVNIDATNVTQSFVVTDTWQSDMPVIYVSDGFEVLTGYPREEVLGRNCRFLQARNGMVKQGASRECVSSASAHELKEKIAMGQEVQHVIVNFRKSGEPLNNLLTLVPIPWDGVMSRFWFGFQADISQQPTSLNLSLNSVHEGSLLHRRKVQSSLHKPPPSVADQQVIKNEPEAEIADMPESAARTSPESTRDRSEETGIGSIDTSALATDLLTTLVDPENQNGLSNKTAWSDMLLQNVDGLLQVLSLKGTIVYISPSCHRLGYISTLLLGSSIENICHPSDKLIVRRELKNATTDKEIDIVFRIKQHDGDYVWYHNYGSVWADGGRRWAVLVGRQLTMFALSRQVLDNIGGLGERDIWMKLSTSGLVLSVFPNPLPALGMPAEKLIGTSFHELIINGSVKLCKDLVSRARNGNAVSANVAMQSARGHSLHVELTIHPGQPKQPQFHSQYFVFAQCRFVKATSHKSNAVPAQVLSKQTIQQHIFPNPSVCGDNLLSNLEANNCGVLQYDMHQLMTENENLRDELQNLEKLSKQRKRLRVSGGTFRGCANCHTRQTPEWRRGPSGRRDLCNSCGLRWAKSVRTSSQS